MANITIWTVVFIATLLTPAHISLTFSCRIALFADGPAAPFPAHPVVKVTDKLIILTQGFLALYTLVLAIGTEGIIAAIGTTVRDRFFSANDATGFSAFQLLDSGSSGIFQLS